MTVSQAIDRVDRLKPNSYSYADKLVWLGELDGRVKREIIDAYTGGEDKKFVPYVPADAENGESDRADAVLLAEEPYDEMYIHYLCARIDYANCEYDRFNNSDAMFEAAYSAFRNAYNREHDAKTRKKNYW